VYTEYVVNNIVNKLTDADIKNYLEEAGKQALLNVQTQDGGPFGAAILTKDGIAIYDRNHVLEYNDPTAHAEVSAIRKAFKELRTYDLEGCILFASSKPCPMCLAAIIWSNIKVCYYGLSDEVAASIGFRDSDIYEYINAIDKEKDLKTFDKFPKLLTLIKGDDPASALKAFRDYSQNGEVIY
jgi:tRNA(Arg) A34 adenosine deaminase TadA